MAEGWRAALMTQLQSFECLNNLDSVLAWALCLSQGLLESGSHLETLSLLSTCPRLSPASPSLIFLPFSSHYLSSSLTFSLFFYLFLFFSLFFHPLSLSLSSCVSSLSSLSFLSLLL